MDATDKTTPVRGGNVRLISEFVLKLTPFDERDALRLVEARGETMRRLLKKLIPALQLATAVDVGCGVGFFSQMLRECGLQVRGFDGRSQNVAEARARFPDIPFAQGDIENTAVRDAAKFDLVLCFGLLYHLENPLLAMRNLQAITGKCLLLESICLPGDKTETLLREEPRRDNQSLSDVAFYPSEAALIKMMYRAGFHVVYRLVNLPQHDDFRETATHKRRRTMLLASHFPLDFAGLRLCTEPKDAFDPWSKALPPASGLFGRTGRFLKLTRREKYFAMARRARRLFPMVKIPFRLPFGAWWLAENSVLDYELAHNGYETAELSFVERLLRPGMTVLDLGAHHGLYSLLAARCVGPGGKVIAFEPSPREVRRLQRHVKLNRATNVTIEPVALGPKSDDAELFVVENGQDGCNSLRPPAVLEPVRTVRVPVRCVDEELQRLGVTRVDFIKLDVEGAELGVLRGADKILNGSSRPAILAEVQDLRTQPWGYPAREILRFLARRGYRWFALDMDGNLVPVSIQEPAYDANLVALPVERVREIIVMLNEGAYRYRRPKAPASLRWSVVARGRRTRTWLTSRSYKSWLPRANETSGAAKGATEGF
ncbi:MAG TPA: FkbM family methyltransferase [Candidatus Acidoferrum sp.]|nr:FkbM family methyltransferase [Candidatus Acidoferrum sp.]